jgi:hypothetical protein
MSVAVMERNILLLDLCILTTFPWTLIEVRQPLNIVSVPEPMSIPRTGGWATNKIRPEPGGEQDTEVFG